MSWLSKATGIHVKVGGTVGAIANKVGNTAFDVVKATAPPVAIVNAKVEGKSWNDALKAGGRAVLADAAIVGAVVAGPTVIGWAGSAASATGSAVSSAAGSVGSAAAAAGKTSMSWLSEGIKKIGAAAGITKGTVQTSVQDVVKGAVNKAETWAKGQFDHAVDSTANTITDARQGYATYSAATSFWNQWKVPILVAGVGTAAFLLARSSARR